MKKFYLILISLLFICSVTLATLLYLQHVSNSKICILLIDKQKLQLSAITKLGEVFKSFPIAVGTGVGNKKTKGDLKTPEGVFKVQEIENSKDWTYDFKDSLGPITGAYGPWFIRLDIPNQKGIGIHGTHDSSTIGQRVSHGCIRMKNEDLEELKSLLSKDIPVIISGGLKDFIADSLSKKGAVMP